MESYAELEREYAELRQEYADIRRQRKRAGFFDWLCQLLLIALAVVGGYFLLSVYVAEAPEQGTRPATTTQPRLPINRPSPSGGNTAPAPVVAPLPDCATVQDTRTACRQGEQPTVEPTATEGEPAYLSSCITPPGARPCWLPEGQAWEEPREVPETPVVLATSVPLVFSDSPCAAWHPPLKLPEGCE